MTRSSAPLAPTILLEDTHLAVLDKPAGLLSQGESRGEPNLVDWLREYFGRNYVGLIHRLDRNTSGVMVVAKRSKSAQRLTDALQKGTLRREYLAWLRGELAEAREWRHWLLKDERTNRVHARRAPGAGAKEARLRVEPLMRTRFQGQPLTLARFVLDTGRSHQIRAQASAEGLPLLGDRKYAGSSKVPAPPAFPRPALHSWTIEFPHPMSGELMKVRAPVPADFLSVSRIEESSL